jgi:hypothetical protein
MIFVVSEALEDLRPAQIRKRGANAVHIPTKKKVSNDIMHTDSCAFDPRVSAADPLGLHDVAIVRCGFHEPNYITTARKIDIVFGWKDCFREPNMQAACALQNYFGAREATRLRQGYGVVARYGTILEQANLRFFRSTARRAAGPTTVSVSIAHR